MLSIKRITLFALAACLATASVLSTRDAAKIKNDLNTVSRDIVSADKAARAYDGTGVKFIQYYSNTTQLNEDLNTLQKEEAITPSLPSAQCTAFVNFIAKTIEPNARNYISTLIVKKQPFTKAGVASVVKRQLTEFQSDIGNAQGGLCNLCPTSKCVNYVQVIQSDIQQGIDAYSDS